MTREDWMRRRGLRPAPHTPGMIAKNQTFNPPVVMPPLVQAINQNTAPGFGRNQIAQFNQDTQFIESYRQTINAGDNTFTPTLSASGIFFKGIAISTSAFSSLADTQVTFLINNRQILTNVSALILIPNYSQGLLYYPIPQLLTGKDTFKMNFKKNDPGSIVAYTSFVFVPAL